MNINDIIEAIEDDQIRISDHADEEAQEDDLAFEAIFYSVFGAEIIKDYPTARPCPKCLVFGTTPNGEPVHSVWGYDQGKQLAILITVYRPNPDRWIDWRMR